MKKDPNKISFEDLNPEPNPLGKTYWEYYRNNYLIVLIVTLIIMAGAIVEPMLHDSWTWANPLIIAFMVVINGTTFGVSYYQYKNRI